MQQPGQPAPRIRIVPAASPAGSLAGSYAMGTPGRRRSAARIAKDIGLFFAAPFVTLACVSLFPVIALAMLLQAWRHRKKAG